MGLRSMLIGVLRSMYVCGFDPEVEILRKIAFNATRGYRHGNKLV